MVWKQMIEIVERLEDYRLGRPAVEDFFRRKGVEKEESIKISLKELKN